MILHGPTSSIKRSPSQTVVGSSFHFDEHSLNIFQVWKNVYPKLVPLLESNRAHNKERDHLQRLAQRQLHVHRLLNKIRTSFPPLVKVKVAWSDNGEHDNSSDLRSTRIDMPFPTTAELLTWPVIKDLIESDSSAKEVEKVLNQRRGDIDQALSDWRAKVVQDVLDVWFQEPEEESSIARAGGSRGKQRASKSFAQQAKDISLARAKTRRKSRKGKEPASSNYDLTCGTLLPQCTVTFTKPDGTTTEDLDSLPEHLRLLFRADTLFVSNSHSHFYPEILPGHFNTSIVKYSGGTSSFGLVWEPDEVKRDNNGSATAKLLLEILGVPDATHPQMKVVGQGFLCQRCSHELPASWERIVSPCILISALITKHNDAS